MIAYSPCCGKSLHSLTNRYFNLLSANPTKWSNILKQFVGNLPTNCFSVFDHFLWLTLKWLNHVHLSLTVIPSSCRRFFVAVHKNKKAKSYMTTFCIRFLFFLSFFLSFFVFAIINLYHCSSKQAFTTMQTKFVDLHCELPKSRRQIILLHEFDSAV